jgi:hypothetical protein
MIVHDWDDARSIAILKNVCKANPGRPRFSHGGGDRSDQRRRRTWQAPRHQHARRVSHPAGRKAMFLGDLVDRGPKTPDVLRLVMGMVADGAAYCVPGNHDMKLMRKLRGRDVRIEIGASVRFRGPARSRRLARPRVRPVELVDLEPDRMIAICSSDSGVRIRILNVPRQTFEPTSQLNSQTPDDSTSRRRPTPLEPPIGAGIRACSSVANGCPCSRPRRDELGEAR